MRPPITLRSLGLRLGIGAALLTALGAASAPVQPAAQVAPGRDLFTNLGCASCHGSVGQGGAGPRLAPDPRPVAVLIAYVRKPAGDMPPFTAKLAADADLEAIQAYLASIAKPVDGPRSAEAGRATPR